MTEGLFQPSDGVSPESQHDPLAELVSSIGNLKPVSDSALRVIELTEGDDATIDELTTAIDVTLASKLLRLANSGYYGPRGTVGSVRDAVLLLGFEAVRSAAFASEFIAHAGDLGFFNARRFWSYSVTVGELTQLVASAHRRHRGEAFTAGLLHGVGRMALAQHDGARLADARARSQLRRIELAEALSDLFGTGDAQLGGALAREWGFPDNLVASISHHGVAPEAQPDPTSLSADVERACAFARACGLTDGIEPVQPRATRELDSAWLSPVLSSALQRAGGMPAVRDRAHAFVANAIGETERAA